MSGAANPTAALIAALWERNLPLVRERVAMLERAAKACEEGSLGAAQREEALGAAHKLAGALGMYGRGEAGAIASQMEQMLEGEDAVDATKLAWLAADLGRSLFV